MAIRRLEPHPNQQAWAASGAISLELAPKPYTITRMAIVVRASVTTTTATWFNDPWDRIISRLNLSGAGKTFFDFTNMRAAYHFSRLAGFAPKRPTTVADSATTLLQQFAYIFHFGIAPFKVNPVTGVLEDNPWDLTAGIPPVEAGNLTLGGSFAAAAAMGTNVTTADADFDVYLYGVQPQAGDPPAAYMPQAFPVWSMRTPTPVATSSAFATQDNIPAGDHLHSMLVMMTNGTNAPRDDSMLNSFEIFNQLESRSILKFGGQSGSILDVKAAELLTQFHIRGWPPSDNISTAMTAATGTVAVPSVLAPADSGLYWIPLHQFATRGHPLYGVDLRRVATGDLQARYGVSDATGVTLDMVYRKYQLNPNHPANAAA
jgi:hypothetical protein